MKIKKSTLVRLFEACDFKNVGEWKDAVLLKKAAKLPALAEANEIELEDEDLATALAALGEAIEEEEEIVLVADAPAKGKKAAKAEVEEDEDDEEEEAPKTKKTTKAGGSGKKVTKPAKASKASKADDDDEDSVPVKAKKKKAEKGPGVISSIIEFLSAASKAEPITKEQLLKKLVKRFPERAAEAMSSTINIQVPSRLRTDKGIEVKRDEDGGYYVAKRAKATA